MLKLLHKVPAGLYALLIILTSCPAYSEVYVINARQFAKQSEAIDVRAYADDSPKTVTLEWATDQNSGQIGMTLEPASEYWLAAIPESAVQGTVLRYTLRADYGQNLSAASPEYVLYLCKEYSYITPKAMNLNAKVLVRKKWNSDDDAFGLFRASEGPEFGPSSIICHNNNIYLLDGVKKRIRCFDQAGNPQTSISLPTAAANDMAVDPADSSFVVVSQLEDKIYRVKHGAPAQTLPLGLKRKVAYPAKFTYDASSETLYAEDSAQQNRLRGVVRKGRNLAAASSRAEKNPEVICEASGNNILLRLGSQSKIYAVTFDKPVACIEESLADSNGIVWILFTLEGDYRIRRLARVNTLKGLAQTAETDIWFSFEAARRMALTRKGVVLFAGDAEEGRLVSFDYAGGVQ